MTYQDLDRMIYIKVNKRPWVAWLTPEDEIMMIATDEKPFTVEDMIPVGEYLEQEGFFQEHFERKSAHDTI